MEIVKAAGKIERLEQQLDGKAPTRHPRHRAHALGHARRADHSQRAPAHRLHGHIAVVHNGIIENSARSGSMLQQRGHTFASETDTEVLAHLIEERYEGNLEEAVIDGAARRSKARTASR